MEIFNTRFYNNKAVNENITKGINFGERKRQSLIIFFGDDLTEDEIFLKQHFVSDAR